MGTLQKRIRVKKQELTVTTTPVVLQIGDRVKLTDKAFKTFYLVTQDSGLRESKVSMVLKEGLVALEDRLLGYWTWKLSDLIKIGGEK